MMFFFIGKDGLLKKELCSADSQGDDELIVIITLYIDSLLKIWSFFFVLLINVLFIFTDLLGSPSKEQRPAFELIHSGTFESSDSFEQSAISTGGGDKAADLFGASPAFGKIFQICVFKYKGRMEMRISFSHQNELCFLHKNTFSGAGSSVGFDWSSPSSFQRKDDELELDFSIDKDEEEEEDIDNQADERKIHAQSTNEEEGNLL